MTRQLAAHTAAAWALLFAAPHVYWSTGQHAGLDTALDPGTIEAAGNTMAPVCALIAAVCGLAAGLALLAGRPRAPRRTLRALCWVGAVVLIGRCVSIVVTFVPDLLGLTVLTDREHTELVRLARWYGAVWGPWFVLGAIVWTALALAVRRDHRAATRVSALTDPRRRTATNR